MRRGVHIGVTFLVLNCCVSYCHGSGHHFAECRADQQFDGGRFGGGSRSTSAAATGTLRLSVGCRARSIFWARR